MSFLGQMQGLIISITLMLYLLTYDAADDNKGPAYHHCPATSFSYGAGSTFEESLNQTLFTRLFADATLRTYSKVTNGTGINQVTALYFCRGDVDVDTCHRCINAAVQVIVQKCKYKKEGIVWYEFCTLRYANHTISSLDEEILYKTHYNDTGLVSDPILEPHRDLFNMTMTSLFSKAAYNKNPLGFATNETSLSASQKLRGFAQCSPYISNNLCEKCLSNAYSKMLQWAITIVFLPSCNLGFDLIGPPSPTGPPSSPKKNPLSEHYKVLLQVLLPVVMFFSIVGAFWFWRWRCRPSGGTNNVTEATKDETEIEDASRLQLARFTYSQIKDMTNDFNRVLGEGGYGIVYYGRLSDNHREVAVKVLSKNDAPKQFSNEVNVLGRIYHKNLVTLIGFCEEGTSNLALVYEYLSGGDLKALLSEHSGVFISWKRRLSIAFDTAKGLDYLHTGCSPPIVHRDVKPANILLNRDYHKAKVADFGFSKIFPAEYVSKLKTRVIGTTGYLDPQYHLTGQVNEKSDVYSFGVVLLELITGKSAIIKNTNTHLVQWVTPLFERGDIGSILDPRLHIEIGENYNTLWRATELAKKCVELDATDRPTMSDIVIELRECLARENADVESSSSATTEMMTAVVSSASMSPHPR
ncbi:receptor-like protein kinase At3g21340 isoform X2 [Chenopodium quinoa]|uniref:receptor-like protein kinase At3g21340 isoform X2 n=1 Tax=Chenopodium quinoa TaxID=63459 RepID=UPI000B77C65C|nr:receptor-like protein kinase At3g21340 isoform X2 [Chenopodium quinoa]